MREFRKRYRFYCGSQGYHSYFRNEKDELFSFGWNSKFQCGIITDRPRSIFSPKKVDFFQKKKIFLKKIAVGHEFTLFLSNKNLVFGCGSNGFGQLGTGNKVSPGHKFSSTRLNEKEDIFIEITKNYIKKYPNSTSIDIACGYGHSAIKLDSNELILSGYNQKGQLARGKLNVDETQFEKMSTVHFKIDLFECGEVHTLMTNMKGHIYYVGEIHNEGSSLIPRLLCNTKKFIKIASGCQHVIGISTNQKLYGFGYGKKYGQLGRLLIDMMKFDIIYDFKDIKVKDIRCGFYYTLLIDSNDNAIGMGDSTFAMQNIGIPFYTKNIVIKKQHPKIIKKNVVQIECGARFYFVITRNEKYVFSCGDNEDGSCALPKKGNLDLQINRDLLISNFMKEKYSINVINGLRDLERHIYYNVIIKMKRI